jgi:CheY-like chemotaxis protein
LPVSQAELGNRRSPQEVKQQATARSEAAANPELIRLPSKRVLVVDDGEANRRLIELVLTRAGAQVTTANNGLEAIKSLSETDFAMVYMDMQMPVMDGYAATKRIRSCKSRVPIVALTGNAMKGDREKCIEAGCDDFLAKPVDLDALIRCSAKYIGQAEISEDPAVQEPSCAMVQTETQVSATSCQAAPIHSSLPMDDAELREIVGDFIDRLDDRLEKIERACAEGDFETLRAEAHWLKGSGGTVGFAEFGGPAAALEMAAKDADNEQAFNLLRSIFEIRQRLVHPMHGGTPQRPGLRENGPTADDSLRDPTNSVVPEGQDANPGEPIYCELPLDDPDFLGIVVDFLGRLDPRLEAMSQLLSDGKYEELSNEAHWLKGAGGTVGFPAFTRPAMALLQAARDEKADAAALHLKEVTSVRQRIVVLETPVAGYH